MTSLRCIGIFSVRSIRQSLLSLLVKFFFKISISNQVMGKSRVSSFFLTHGVHNGSMIDMVLNI